MSDNRQTEKKKAGKKKKPLRRAKRLGSEPLRMALRLLSLMTAVIVMGLMFSALQAIESAWLRAALSLAIASGMLLMCVNEGLSKGIKDAGASRYYQDAAGKGTALEKKDDAACYSEIKALCAALLVFGAPLALSAYIALTTEGYTYALQDLPAWLTETYGSRGDVMAPLGAYAQDMALTAVDIIRMIVRLPVMIYINLFSDPITMSAEIDRVVPLFMATYPAAYMVGYLAAPYASRKREKMNRRAKRSAMRKAQKTNLAKTLVADQHGVHYGHRADEGKHKKKELV